MTLVSLTTHFSFTFIILEAKNFKCNGLGVGEDMSLKVLREVLRKFGICCMIKHILVFQVKGVSKLYSFKERNSQ